MPLLETRRQFLLQAGIAAAALPLARISFASPSAFGGAANVSPFDLSRVRLLPGPFLDAAEVNRRFLMNLEPDRLLHMFRVTAGLPSDAAPLGGWEAPENELRGHFTGHYLSACAMRTAAFGDDEAKTRGDRIVDELSRCQAKLKNGYLSAFPESFFDRLRADERVWAPFYTLHKILAGLLDMHSVAGNARALEVATGLATWIARWTQPLGDAAMARVLEREYGGMNEALYNLAGVTGNEDFRELAHRFDHERIFAPLAEGRDELKGLHANTTIPKIIGAARRYELTGETRDREIAEYFWREVSQRRAYCTGGTSNGESWNAGPGAIASELSGYTQECCVTYNMLKLTRHVFEWTGDSACSDYAERATWNGILGTQHPADGSKLYYVPLASGYWKLFGTPLHDFWCCTGTGSESFSKLGGGIYFRSGEALRVEQLVASELDWKEKGLRVIQETRFPEEGKTALTIRGASPVRAEIRFRVPGWANKGSARLNGRALEGFAAPGGSFVLDRVWSDGDRVELELPLALHVEATPDDPSLGAVMYGPIVLAGRLGDKGLTPATLRAEPTKPRTVPEYKLDAVAAPELVLGSGDGIASIQPTGKPLEFRATGMAAGKRGDVPLAPLSSIFDERYAVYWKIRNA
ncbi:MAG: beta-L-arabinofuranosidase domain-containing protein [Thermoanaerobaculia bacterium]